jgi:hypothetical protein
MILLMLLNLLLQRHMLHGLDWHWWHLLHGHYHTIATKHISSATVVHTSTTTKRSSSATMVHASTTINNINSSISSTVHLHPGILMRKHGML